MESSTIPHQPPAATGDPNQPPAAPPEQPTEQREQSLREIYDAWPQRGGLKDDDGNPRPQPWDMDAHDLDPRTFPDAGEPDDVSPVVVAHSKPVLGALSQGPEVIELAAALGELGFPNSHTRGENPNAVLDSSILQAVAKFRDEYGVDEAPSEALGGHTAEGRQIANRHVGPYTHEAIRRVLADPQKHGHEQR